MKKLMMLALLIPALCSAQMVMTGNSRKLFAPAATAIRSTNQTYSAAATSLTAPIPTGAQVGDLCVFVIQAHNSSINATGWTANSVSNLSWYNGGFFSKTLASGDLTSGITVTTGGGAEGMLLVGVDFNPSVTAVVTSAANATGSSSTATSTTAPALSGVAAGDTVIYVAGMRGSGTVTSVSRGTLLQSKSDATGVVDASVYGETLTAGFSTAVTYNLPGTYNPNGYWTGWIAVH